MYHNGCGKRNGQADEIVSCFMCNPMQASRCCGSDKSIKSAETRIPGGSQGLCLLNDSFVACLPTWKEWAMRTKSDAGIHRQSGCEAAHLEHQVNVQESCFIAFVCA